MSNKQKIIAISCVFIVVIIIIVVGKVSKNNKDVLSNTNELNYEYNKDNKEYTIYGENNEVKGTVKSEGELKKYMDDPDYNPGIGDTTFEMDAVNIDE